MAQKIPNKSSLSASGYSQKSPISIIVIESVSRTEDIHAPIRFTDNETPGACSQSPIYQA